LSCRLRVRLSRSDKADRMARARFVAGDDRADLPTQIAKPASERATHTARSDDSEAIFHPC
jgi:hypothetical protein